MTGSRPLLLLLPVLLLVAACSPKSVDDYNDASSETGVVRLLNQREYGKVIFEIESRDGKLPDDKKTAFLLGQAYLGKAGFEPLKIAAAVGGAQDDSSQDAQDMLPACASGDLGPAHDADPLCLLKRVYFQVPDADVYEMSRAREIFRHAYPDAAATNENVNVLIGAVEAAGVIKRAGALFLFAERAARSGSVPTDDEARWFARQLKELIDEADQTLTRAQHTGNFISQVLTGSKGEVWFNEAQGAIKWAEKTGLGGLFDVIRQYALSPGDQAKYAPILDKLRKYLDDQNARILAL